ncbi:MAG: contractile injection system protein, VgrG/Pvc8 family [Clostridiales bacterium]|nr:contractile injection system protein, VgrG/Pvc8 family [Clostridiales bacterium]
MKPIDVGKINVDPFEFESIQEIKITKKLNEHSTLYVNGIIRDDKRFAPADDTTEGTSIKCENDGQVYFSGVLQNIKITCVDAVYHLEAWAVSNTILLDTVKHKRSFQDNGQDYKSIVEAVIAENGGTATFNTEALTVENIILQYNETDWAFAKRLASHTNDVLVPITDDSPAFHFGAPNDGGAKALSKNYAVSKDYDAIRRMSMEADPLTADDITIYSFEADEYICDLGEKLSLNEVDLHVCCLSLSLVDSALRVTYILCGRKAVSAPKAYNRAITGLVLDGTVTEVENDTIKLRLDDDVERGVEQDTDEAHFFTYATGYSMESHTGWYVMPEEGDTVQLLFPNEDEKYAYAASSVRQEDTDKTADHMVKYLRTSYGKEIKLDEKEILITAKDGETFIQINEDSGITIKTPNAILIKGGSTITMDSEDDMTLNTNKNLNVTAKDSIVVNCGGNNIKIEPPSGIAVTTDKEINVDSGENISIDGKMEVSVKSGKDMNLESSSKLAESAEKKLEMACSGSTITMDGNVDIKATLIKEN